MNYVGVDLHKQSITVCVVNHARKVMKRQRLLCAQPDSLKEFFENLGEFQAVIEATASYEWFVRLIEPFADKIVLAHPGKLRVIAESTRKSDKLDAQVLAEFLLEMEGWPLLQLRSVSQEFWGTNHFPAVRHLPN